MDLKSKKDETIVDFCYRISNDGKQHCIWMLDEKYQVWKCTSELNPNSYNWTSVKVAVPDHLVFMSFLQPAMTFDDYHFSMSLNKLKCFRNWTSDNSRRQNHQFVYNYTATKIGNLRQPQFRSRINDGEFM